MSKQKRQFDNDGRLPYKEHAARPTQPGICADFLEHKGEFRWFIEKYFGSLKFTTMVQLAEEGKEDQLKAECNDVWFRLPDSILNVRERPRGWMQFLKLVED